MKSDIEHLLSRTNLTEDAAVDAALHLDDCYGVNGWTLPAWRERLEDLGYEIADDARPSELRAVLKWAREQNNDVDENDDEEGGDDE